MWQQIHGNARRQAAILLALGLLYGCILGSQFYVARLVNALGGSATIAGLLLVASLVPVFIVALFGQRLARRWSPRQLLRMGLACHALQLLLLALSPNLAVLVPSMILGGFGYALCFAPLLNSATAILPRTHYAQAIAYFSLAVQMGVGLSSVMAAIIEPLLGTRGTFWIPMLLSLAAQCFAHHLSAEKAAQAALPGTALAAAAAPQPRGNLLEVFLLMGVLGLTFGLPLQFVPMWLGSTPSMNFSPAYFLTTSFFTIMATRLIFGHWLNGTREMPVVIVCFTVVVLAIAVLGQAHTPWQFAACALAYGAAYSLLYPSCTAYLIKQVGQEERNAWSNWVLLGYEIGTRFLPALFGVVADLGGFPLTFRLLAMVIAGVGLWHVVKRLRLMHGERAVTHAV